MQTSSGNLVLAPAGTAAVTFGATAVTLSFGRVLELPVQAQVKSLGNTMSFKVNNGTGFVTPLTVGHTQITVAQTIVLAPVGTTQTCYTVKATPRTGNKAYDLVLEGGHGSGQNAGGGHVIIRAGKHLMNTAGVSAVTSGLTGTCSAETLFGISYFTLSPAQFATLIDRCSPGRIELISDNSKYLLLETVSVDSLSTIGKHQFWADNVKAMEIRHNQVETFVALTVNGFALQVSDHRVKKDIVDAPPTSLDNFRKLRLREYAHHPTFAEASKHGYRGRAKGFIAQEVAEVLPHAVQQFDKSFQAEGHEDLNVSDMHHLQYDYIYLEMFGAVKEMLADLDQLKSDVESLKAKLP